MNILKPAIDHHGMTAMHTHWGGSHDSILGFVFWMYDIPTYSFNKYLFPTRVMIHNTNKDVFTVKLKRRNSVFVHHVICADQYQYRTVDRQRKAEISGRIACQYNIAEMLNDDVLYNNQSFAETMSPETVVKYYEALQSQWRAGLDSSKLLIAMANTTVSNIRRTIFRERAIRLPEYFEPFTPFDCKLHANAMP